MRVLTFSVDITPPPGLPMGGNVREDDLARGTNDNLFANLIILEEGEEKVCFIGFDYVGLDIVLCNKLRDSVTGVCDIKRENIIINATHTHSGPDVMGIFKDETHGGALKYFDECVVKITNALKDEGNNCFEGTLWYARKEVSDLSFNRRLVMEDHSLRMNWEGVDPKKVLGAAGPVDRDLHLICIRGKDGKTKAMMVNFTLHPAVLVGEGWLWSRDYVGYMTDYLKERVEGDPVVLFTNGAEGNINHINYLDREQKRGFEEAERIGRTLGAHVHGLMTGIKPLNTKGRFKVKHKTIKLPLREISPQRVKWAEELLIRQGDYIPSLLDGVPDEIYAREIIKLAADKNDHITTDINAVVMDDVLLTTFPGEVFAEFALYVKEHSGYKNTIVTGLTNDIVGYIPTREAFNEGGYEIKTARTSKLDKEAGYVLVDEVLKLAKAVI